MRAAANASAVQPLPWRAPVLTAAQPLRPPPCAGWKFWVPAASINFWLVPLAHQVLYMSCCGVLWTAYLSYSSNVSANLKLKGA